MIYIAILNNLIVNGSARFLNKLYANDVDIGGTATFANLATTGNATIGGTLGVTGATTQTGKLTVNNVIEQHGDGIELYYSTPHIDFHYGNSTADFTSRIIESAQGVLTITPKLSTPNATITTGNITTLNTNTISNDGAIVTRDMEVVDTLKSYKWDISHVANLANDFTVSPTLQLASGATIRFTAINTSTKVCTFTITDSSSISSDSLGGVTWTQYSKVKFTMNLNDIVNSNCDGYLTFKMNSTAGTMTISGTLDNVTGLNTTTNYNAEGATIMLYEVGAGSQSTTYPVGIRMTAYGSNKRSYIDIYGGTSTSSRNTPHVRIGNVGGLTFNGETLENQWGIYTDMGYFSGAIVSKEGNIGGFLIDQTNIHNNVTSLTDTSHTGIYLGTDGIRNYNTSGSKHVTIKDGTITANSVDLTGKITATSGSISGSLVSSGISASNITTGTLSADRIGAGSLSIGKLDSTTQTKFNTVIKQSIESIIGTQTSNTYSWTGTSATLSASDIVDGLTINYFLPYSVGGSQVGATYLRLSDNTNVNTSGVVLNLTLADGTTTGNIPVWYQGVGRLTSHYGYGAIIKMTYHKDIVMANAYKATGWWVDAQYNSDTVDNRIVYFTGKTGAKGIWAGSLFMEDSVGTYQNICTASDGTATSSNRTTDNNKKANTNGFKVGGTIYYTGTSYNADTNITGTNTIFSSYGNLFDSRYAMNTTLTTGSLTTYKPWYLVGSINATDGLFYLDSTWWTQTPNTTGKVYILGGGVYDSTTSYCRITLYENNMWYVYDGTRLVPYEKYASDIAAKTATNYITYINATDGIKIHNASDTTNYLQMNSTAIKFFKNGTQKMYLDNSNLQFTNGSTVLAQFGTSGATIGQTTGAYGNVVIEGGATNASIKIRQGSTTLADFGDTITLGQSGSGNLKTIIDSGSFVITDSSVIGSSDEIAHIGKGTREITDTFVSDGSKTTFELSSSVASGGTVSPSSVVVSRNGTTLTVSSGLPSDGEKFTYTYTPVNQVTYYTMGTRKALVNYGNLSFAEGYRTVSSGDCSHAEGWITTASGTVSHSEGSNTEASGKYSHAQGEYTTASGDWSHAEGYKTVASGDWSHAEGDWTHASNGASHAEGIDTHASGYCSHAEGSNTNATNYYSHSEGQETTASGESSHAEGYKTVASGDWSHAEGYKTRATAFYSHAQNCGTMATQSFQTVIGKYNSATRTGAGTDASPYVYSNAGDYAFIIGNGNGDDTSSRSNAFTVDWDGLLWTDGGISTTGDITATGALSAGSISTTGDLSAVNITATGKYSGGTSTANKTNQTTIGTYNILDASTTTTHPSGTTDYGEYAFIVGNGTSENARSNAYAVSWDGKRYANGYQIGEIFYDAVDISSTIANADSYQSGGTFTLPPGTYIIWAFGRWGSGSAGTRRVQIYNSTGGWSERTNGFYGQGWMAVQISEAIKITESTTFVARISSYPACSSCAATLKAIRIA